MGTMSGAFEAFRCTRPTGQAQAAAEAAAASPPKRRKTSDGGGAAAVAAAAAGAPAAAPAAWQQQRAAGLALEKMGDAPLRCVIVGHNPRSVSW